LRHHIGVDSETSRPDLGSHRQAKPEKRITAIWAARIGQHLAGHRGRSHCRVRGVGEQTGIGGDHRSAELNHEPPVETKPENFATRFTRRVRHCRHVEEFHNANPMRNASRLNPGKGSKRRASPAKQLSWLRPTSIASHTPSAVGKPPVLPSPRPHSLAPTGNFSDHPAPPETERDNVIELKSALVRVCPAGGAKLVPLDLIHHAKRWATALVQSGLQIVRPIVACVTAGLTEVLRQRRARRKLTRRWERAS